MHKTLLKPVLKCGCFENDRFETAKTIVFNRALLYGAEITGN